VLEETWVSSGRKLRHKVATTVDDGATPDASVFAAPGPALPSQAGGIQLVPLTDDSRPPATFWSLVAPPAGFVHQGRYLVAPSSLATSGSGGTVVDVYVDGARAILIEQGDQASRQSQFQPDARARAAVAAGSLPGAELIPSAYGSVL